MSVYCVDIDGTICDKNICREDGNYENSNPNLERIKKINQLYDEGHKIIYLTARGMGRFKNSRMLAHNTFYDFTYDQLKSWGCKFHELYMGKPSADHYIDDKGISDYDFFN